MRKSLAVLLSILGFYCAAGLAAEENRLTGHWEGAIVAVPAEQEVEMAVDFNPGGQLKDQLWFPVTADGAHDVENLRVQGSRVTFSVHDSAGVVSVFDGGFVANGSSIRGAMKESGRTMPFTLRRVQAARRAREVPIFKLSESGIELTNAFNADAGSVRMLLLLNPVSFPSRMELSLVERFVLEQVKDSGLHVYAVWLASDRPEAQKLIQRLAELAPDPRITHFLATRRSSVKIFEPGLALYKAESNPCLLFGPQRTWSGLPPLPDRIRQGPMAGEPTPANPRQKFNGIELAADVRQLLKPGTAR